MPKGDMEQTTLCPRLPHIVHHQRLLLLLRKPLQRLLTLEVVVVVLNLNLNLQEQRPCNPSRLHRLPKHNLNLQVQRKSIVVAAVRSFRFSIHAAEFE